MTPIIPFDGPGRPKGAPKAQVLSAPRGALAAVLSRRDLYAGLLLVAIGGGVVAEGARHPVGSLTQMGTGFFPVALGVILMLLGIAIAASSVLSGDGAVEMEPGEAFHLPDIRGCAAIITGVVAFIAIGAYFGLAPATFALVFISALGDRTATLRGAVILALAITAVAAGLFWYLLQIQFPIVIW